MSGISLKSCTELEEKSMFVAIDAASRKGGGRWFLACYSYLGQLEFVENDPKKKGRFVGSTTTGTLFCAQKGPKTGTRGGKQNLRARLQIKKKAVLLCSSLIASQLRNLKKPFS